jgi:type II secretory pathway pseudopilin PulG
LVVIIIIAVLASIAIPTFLGQRAHAQDAAAYSLVRNALTAIQGAFVDTGDYSEITVADLQAMEPSIDFQMSDFELVTTSPAWVSPDVPANARLNQVAFYADSADAVDIACESESGNLYAIQVNTIALDETGYVKVRVIEGDTTLGW